MAERMASTSPRNQGFLLSGLQCQAHLSKEESERHWSQPLLHNSERGRVDRFGVFLMLMTLYVLAERERERERENANSVDIVRV